MDGYLYWNYKSCRWLLVLKWRELLKGGGLKMQGPLYGHLIIYGGLKSHGPLYIIRWPYSGPCILRPPSQPVKCGRQLKVVLEWSDICTETRGVVSLQ